MGWNRLSLILRCSAHLGKAEAPHRGYAVWRCLREARRLAPPPLDLARGAALSASKGRESGSAASENGPYVQPPAPAGRRRPLMRAIVKWVKDCKERRADPIQSKSRREMIGDVVTSRVRETQDVRKASGVGRKAAPTLDSSQTAAPRQSPRREAPPSPTEARRARARRCAVDRLGWPAAPS
jgi:hypothetical protein